MTKTIKVPKEEWDRIHQERAEDRQRISALESEIAEYRDENERDKATIRQKVTEVASGDENDSADIVDDKLPIERLDEIGEHTHVHKSVERAAVIYEHFRQWSSKAPAGRTITDGLLRLVETATGDQLYWKQIERACEKLEIWTRGAIQFETHPKKGRILVEQSSSAGASTRPSG